MKRSILWFALALLPRIAVAGSSCSPTLFVQAASIPVGDRPTNVLVAFIDGDAIPDLVTANDSSFSVLLGQPAGGFSAPIVTPTNIRFAIAAGDFNGDTKTDIAVGYFSEVLIFLGHGDGTFDPPVEYSVSNGEISAIVTGTFDANATLDLAVADGYSGNEGITILPGVGDGTFGSSTRYSVLGAHSLTAADLNGDDKLDLATADSQGTVSVLVGHGDGTFDSPVSFLAGASPNGIAAADLDGDGHPDLLTTTSGFLSVLMGNGDATFQAALQYPTGVSTGQVLAADFDSDGSLDAAVSATSGGFSGPGGLVILVGRGDGSFEPPAAYIGGESSSGLASGDLDGDGLPDLVTADPDHRSVTVFRDQAGGVLFAAPFSSVPFIPNPPILAQADLDGDGFADLAYPFGGGTQILLGAPHGRFRSGNLLADPDNQSVEGVAAGVFVSGGQPDLIVSSFLTLWRFPNLGAGVFGPAEFILSAPPLGASFVGDFNGDGKLDAAAMSQCCSSQVYVALGNGDGTFQPVITTSYLLNALQPLFVGDLTGDGKTDLLVYANPGMLLLPGNGDGTFGTPLPLSQDNGYSQAAVGDFNGDTFPDVALAGSDPNVAIFFGNGDGTFQPPTFVALDRGSFAIVAGDYDGDGSLDFAVLTDRLLFFAGLGNGHFQAPVEFLAAGSPYFLLSADLDANGALDIVVGSGSSTLTTMLNTRLGAVVRDVSVIVGSPAVLHASAAGFGPLTYQWRKDGVPLSDGGTISGATTSTLTIDPVAFTDAGSYDVVVADSCTNTTSNAATLSVEFDDVPLDSPFHSDILTIATTGIATGCTDTSYCPANPVSRAEMAVFLLKAKYGADHLPPPPVQIFPDVPNDAFAAAWIDELASLGITAGCGDGNGNYCPNDPVTRGQMAVFLLKTLLGSDYVPPPPAGVFADVPADYFSIAWIEDLYNRGITAGCNTNPLRFCPDADVPREQMATFLVRTFLGP